MDTTTLEQKVNKLEKEVAILRSALSSIATSDPEGEYKDSFIKDILSRTTDNPEGKIEDEQDLKKLFSADTKPE